MANEDTIFVGSGKTINFKTGGYKIGISVCIEDIPEEHTFVAPNGKTYVRLDVVKKKETDQYGKTHFVAVNTWKPDNMKGNVNNGPLPGDPAADEFGPEEFDDDIPF